MKQINYGGNMLSKVFNAFNAIESCEHSAATLKRDFLAGDFSETEYDSKLEALKDAHSDDWKNFKAALSFREETKSGLTISVNAVDMLNDAIASGYVSESVAAYVMAIITGRDDAGRYVGAFMEWLSAANGAKIRKGFTVKKNKKEGTVCVKRQDTLVFSSLKGKGAKIIHGLIHDALMTASLKTDKITVDDDGWKLPDSMIK